MAFEQGVNPIIAEKLTSERSRDYMTARRVAKEYEASTRGLNKLAPCFPTKGAGKEMRLVILLGMGGLVFDLGTQLRLFDRPQVGQGVRGVNLRIK